MILITCIIGALFRRFWGGWLFSNSFIKRVLGFVLPLSVCFIHNGTEAWAFNMLASGIVLFAWLMPYHGYALNMGRDPERPLWKCVLVMGGQYGGVTTAIGILAFSLLGHGLLYIPVGFAVPFFYLIGWNVFPKGANIFEYPKGNVFIDGAGAFSELCLGALILGGLWMV